MSLYELAILGAAAPHEREALTASLRGMIEDFGLNGEYPKRGLRLALCFPVTIKMLSGSVEAMVENLSQQGARLTCDRLLAIDQTVRMEMPDLSGKPREVRAKVRWRRDQQYGVVFDDTFTLGDFARLAALLQAPALLEEAAPGA